MVLALCLVLAVVETMRTRSIWIIPFIIAVVGGEELLTNTIKQLADRIRPAFNPAAATLGPSFPSGHSATAAAFYAAAALLLSRQRLRPTRAVAGRARGRDRGRSGSEPRAPRRPLAVRRDRGSGARLGLAGCLRDRLRRPSPPIRRYRRRRRANRKGGELTGIVGSRPRADVRVLESTGHDADGQIGQLVEVRRQVGKLRRSLAPHREVLGESGSATPRVRRRGQSRAPGRRQETACPLRDGLANR